MEIIRYDNALLRKQLDRLPPDHRTVLAAFCAERLFPAYQRFVQEGGRGEPETLRSALPRLWDDLTGNPCPSLSCAPSIKGAGALPVTPVKEVK